MLRTLFFAFAALCLAPIAAAQDGRMPPARPGATDALSTFDGLWIGPARMTGRDGSVTTFDQMERIGPMLRGEIRVMEGKARGADGRTLFNAFTVFSANAAGQIEMRSHIPGDASARIIELRPDGYTWRMQAGGGEMVYEISVRDGVWHETGVYLAANGRRFPFFEMTLRRQGPTDWPAANSAFPTTD